MKTSEFLTVLANAGDTPIRFHTVSGDQVPPGYHVTEVMNVHVNSVDCGGRESSFAKTVVQLWNGATRSGAYLSAAKMKAIFDRVDESRPLLQNEEIFFEWGDAKTNTSTYDIAKVDERGDFVSVELFVQPTVCKPAAELLTNCYSGANSASDQSSAADHLTAEASTRPTGCC